MDAHHGLSRPRSVHSPAVDVAEGWEQKGDTVKRTRYFALRVIVQLIGKKGFSAEKVSSLVPLIKAIE